MMNCLTGLIVKAISGFYYVEAADVLYECKARGNFRKKGIAPAVGDRAEILVINEDLFPVEGSLILNGSLKQRDDVICGKLLENEYLAS